MSEKKTKKETDDGPDQETKIENDIPNENDTTPDKKKIHEIAFDYVIKLFKFLTVEPFLFCYILPNIISALALYNFSMEKACRANLNYSEDICKQMLRGGSNVDNTTKTVLRESQILVSEMTAWKGPLQSALPAIMTSFVGAWSDRTGNRKLLMIIPILGEILCSIFLILDTYYFIEWPLWTTGVIDALPKALSGGFSIALMGSYSYIADVTTTESRTFRIGIVGVIVTLGIPLGSSIGGALTKVVGYYGVFAISLSLYILGFLHTYYRIHNVRETPTEGTFINKFIEFFHPKNVWDTLSLVVMARRRLLIQILLLISACFITIGNVYAEGELKYVYALSKYGMNLQEFSLYSSYNALVGVAGTAIAVTFFSKKLKIHDAFLGVIATACKTGSNLVYSLGPTKFWFYLGPIVNIFGNTASIATRSIGTKIVKPDQVGKICSLIALAEALSPVIFVPIFSKVYANTLESFSGMFFILGSLVTLIVTVIFIFLYIIDRREQKDVVQNPADKEIHAHDNAVSVL